MSSPENHLVDEDRNWVQPESPVNVTKVEEGDQFFQLQRGGNAVIVSSWPLRTPTKENTRIANFLEMHRINPVQEKEAPILIESRLTLDETPD